jgi:NAD(P)H-hydrate epimerase
MSGDRLLAARTFAHTHKCILVLKGHRTITAFPDGTAYINTTGGPAMAKGGSGDVLAGMIASLMGQRFPLKDAVLTAVYTHGLAGDMCAAEYGEYSVTAGDIVAMLPKALLRTAIHKSQSTTHN